MFLASVMPSIKPQYNPYTERPRDWQNLFAVTRFRYIEVLIDIFYYYWGKENRSLYRGLRYIEVRRLYRGSNVPTFTNCNQGDV